MANVTDTITIVFERRPCYVDGRKAMFHQWVQKTPSIEPVCIGDFQTDEGMAEKAKELEQIEPQFSDWIVSPQASIFPCVSAYGIVEYEDGTVELVEPQAIKFADGGGFKETAFIE